MRFLVLCAGVGYRWHDYLGVRKHLIPLDRELLLHRTLRQLQGEDVWVVGPTSYDFAPNLFTPDNPAPTDTSVDKLLSSRELWHVDEPTVCMWGDVWWSDEAIAAVRNFDGDDWHVWYRPGPSSCTGRKHGEFFAHYFLPRHHNQETDACWRVVDLYNQGKLPWLNTGGWAHYRAMLGMSDEEVHGWHDGRNASIVDDWTDDFDMPVNYRTWYGRRAEGRYPVESVRVEGDGSVKPDQFWCAVAHAVEWGQPVVPYSSFDGETFDIHDAANPEPRLVIRPKDQRRDDLVRLDGLLSCP